MQDSTKSAKFDAGILLFDGFSNHCLANAVEPLRAANTFCGFDAYCWHFLTLDGEPAVSSSGLPVVPHTKLSDHAGGDALFLLPSYGFRKYTGPDSLNSIRAASRRFRLLVGMDMGAWLMAAAGLLEGKVATIHWDELRNFSEQFPDIDVVAERFAICNNRLSCGGASTAFDLVLHLIQLHHGPKIRMDVQELFMPDNRPDLLDPMMRPGRSVTLNAAIAVMRQNIEDILTLPEIAKRTGQHQKSMERLFRAELGLTPVQAYRYIRLNEARRLLMKTRLSVAEIALRCGYTDASAMTRAFRIEFGIPPSTWRQHPDAGSLRFGGPNWRSPNPPRPIPKTS